LFRAVVIAVLVLALPAAASAKPPVQAQTAIVGGQAADIADWPSIAFVLAGWDGDGDGTIESAAACTGTVIAARWIISAAHCAFRPDDLPVDAMVTLTGVADINDTSGQAIAADRLVVDPDWDPQTLTGDALLIHLRSNSSRTPMKTAVKGGPYTTPAGVPNAAGWGTIDEDSTIGTDVLQEAYLELQTGDRCAMFAPGFDPATQTCAGTFQTAGACHGDSGGPLVVFDRNTGERYLWGLTSYGPQVLLGLKPCDLRAPAVYSWVPGFQSFIQPTVFPKTTTPPVHVITPPRDTTPPVISHARLSRHKLTRKRGARLSFDLSEAAAVTVTVLKKRRHRFKALSPSIPLAASAGHVSRKFKGKLSGKRLKRGRYKLRLIAVDTAGNASRPKKLAFRIAR
jgi:secreted trypsin-like serine protease